MHRDAGPQHWELIQIQRLQKACITLNRRTNEHIILSLRGFEPIFLVLYEYISCIVYF